MPQLSLSAVSLRLRYATLGCQGDFLLSRPGGHCLPPERGPQPPPCYCYRADCSGLPTLRPPTPQKYASLSGPGGHPPWPPPTPSPITRGFHQPVRYKEGAKLPISGATPQSVEMLLPGNCCQFGSKKLIKIPRGTGEQMTPAGRDSFLSTLPPPR